jgi:hypothetical protein
MKPSVDNLLRTLIGRTAEADHPVTVLNPSKTFRIDDVKLERRGKDMKVFVKGIHTCWFGEEMIKVLDK